MKCPKCNGDGKERNYFGVIIGICPRCYGTGEAQPMTNEEWLQTATTEQLAKALYHITCFTEPLFVKCMRKQTDADAEKAIVEWLKQPHKE